MLTKELILGVLHSHKFRAKVIGTPADIISAEDFDTIAEDILLIAQPNGEPQPQLRQTSCTAQLPPDGFVPLLNELRKKIAMDRGFTDAQCEQCRLALNEVIAIIVRR